MIVIQSNIIYVEGFVLAISVFRRDIYLPFPVLI